MLVPTHGDWHPRNWLVDDGTVRVTDLEVAFLDGYGRDPREPAPWRRTLVGEAVGTSVWAYGVGDHEFEAVGHHQCAALYSG